MSNYPAGAEADPNAPYNQPDNESDWLTGDEIEELEKNSNTRTGLDDV